MSDVTRFGQAPVSMTIGDVPAQSAETPQELRVLKHLVGYTEVELSNGDVIRMHLQVRELHYDADVGGFTPSYNIIPEIIKRGWQNCSPLPEPLS